MVICAAVVEKSCSGSWVLQKPKTHVKRVTANFDANSNKCTTAILSNTSLGRFPLDDSRWKLGEVEIWIIQVFHDELGILFDNKDVALVGDMDLFA